MIRLAALVVTSAVLSGQICQAGLIVLGPTEVDRSGYCIDPAEAVASLVDIAEQPCPFGKCDEIPSDASASKVPVFGGFSIDFVASGASGSGETAVDVKWRFKVLNSRLPVSPVLDGLLKPS